ncbi:MAG: hypothetical protein N4A63_08220 [Vallitalea sp.]|jgi:hypothetical protein|nr:hypothetical protein [Vallitalea sp.]
MIDNKIMAQLLLLDLEDLKEVRNALNNIIRKKSEKTKKVIYTHNCYNSSNYHFRKYKHWSKKITSVDDTKTNGYAFTGDFLKVDKENLVEVGSYIVECCDQSLYLYLLKNEDEVEELATGNYNEFISFIRSVKEITKL